MFLNKLVRRKTLQDDTLQTPLNRCMTTCDIVLLGIGSMVGGGIYVLTGQVANRITGPAVLISFLLAGLASLLAALSFAEFGTWVPRAGSAYTYTYVTMGEIWAFVIGWNILLEHIIGGAAVARTWSAYLNSLSNDWIRNQSRTYLSFPWAHQVGTGGKEPWGPFSDYPDFGAALIIFLICIFVSSGAKSTTRFNHFFTMFNIAVITFIVCYGLNFANVANWANFMPFGPASIVAGASRCFFAYIGFDGIATAAEEAKDPAKAIPRATLVAMSLVTGAYILLSSTLTLMVPWSSIDPDTSFAAAFDTVGVPWAKYIVAIGALSGITTALTGHLFALPRCTYAMSDDGLIFKFLAKVHPKTQVPTLTVGILGFLVAILAVFMDLGALVDLLSIGTLLAYTLVSMCVILLRYRQQDDDRSGLA
jgi:cationic amino acid transporter 4